MPPIPQLTSQNPYTELFIGKPYVYTLDIDNLSELTAALKEISTQPVSWFSYVCVHIYKY